MKEWVRGIACHLFWVPHSCKDPGQQMQLFRSASPCNLSSSISLKKCHQLLWSSVLCKNRMLFNLDKVLHNFLLPIAKWSKGKFCVFEPMVLTAVFTGCTSLSHWSLAVPASVDTGFATSFVLIHQNSSDVKGRIALFSVFFGFFCLKWQKVCPEFIH